MSQFDADDERVGHKRLLDAIRADQLKNEPEPSHEPDCTSYDLKAWGSMQTVDTIETWCCDWHRYHLQEDK